VGTTDGALVSARGRGTPSRYAEHTAGRKKCCVCSAETTRRSTAIPPLRTAVQACCNGVASTPKCSVSELVS